MYGKSEVRSIPLHAVHIQDSFWDKYIRLVKDVILPYQWDTLNDRVEGAQPSHCIKNFKIAAGEENGEFQGAVFRIRMWQNGWKQLPLPWLLREEMKSWRNWRMRPLLWLEEHSVKTVISILIIRFRNRTEGGRIWKKDMNFTRQAHDRSGRCLLSGNGEKKSFLKLYQDLLMLSVKVWTKGRSVPWISRTPGSWIGIGEALSGNQREEISGYSKFS